MYGKKWIVAFGVIFFGIAAINAAAQTETWQIDPAHTETEFSVRHLMISNVKGRFSDVTGSLTYNEASPRAVALEVVPDKIHRFALDEVLHRVGGNERGVVACRVGRPERVPVQEHQHTRAKYGILARRCRRGRRAARSEGSGATVGSDDVVPPERASHHRPPSACCG